MIHCGYFEWLSNEVNNVHNNNVPRIRIVTIDVK